MEWPCHLEHEVSLNHVHNELIPCQSNRYTQFNDRSILQLQAIDMTPLLIDIGWIRYFCRLPYGLRFKNVDIL